MNRRGEPVAGVPGYSSMTECPVAFRPRCLLPSRRPCPRVSGGGACDGNAGALRHLRRLCRDRRQREQQREARLLDLVREHGARLIGPELPRDLLAGRVSMPRSRPAASHPAALRSLHRAALLASRCSSEARLAGSASPRSCRSETRPTSPPTTCSSSGRRTRPPASSCSTSSRSATRASSDVLRAESRARSRSWR